MAVEVINIPTSTNDDYLGTVFLGNESNGDYGLHPYGGASSTDVSRSTAHKWYTNRSSRGGNTCGLADYSSGSLLYYLTPVDSSATIKPRDVIAIPAQADPPTPAIPAKVSYYGSNGIAMGEAKKVKLYSINLMAIGGSYVSTFSEAYTQYYKIGGVFHYWQSPNGHLYIMAHEDYGHGFVQWGDGSKTNPRMYSGGSESIGDISLTAYFTEKFSITFHKNDGSASDVTSSQNNILNGQGAKLNANTWSKSSLYAFAGWATSASATTAEFADKSDADAVFTASGASAGDRIHLYAVWQFIGFTVTVTRAAVAGTLSLYDITAGETVKTESNGVLSYSGEVGHTYQVRCKVGADNFQMPAGIPGLDDDKFTPASEQIYEHTYSSPFYYVSLPAADEHGNSLAVTTPSTYDTQIAVGGATYPAYSAGRKITIKATTGSEYSLVRAELFDSDGYSRAVYSTEDGTIVGDAFQVDLAALGKSFRVEPTYGEKHYTVSIAADVPSAAAGAFEALSAKKQVDGEWVDAGSEVKGTVVRLRAKMNSGFSFAGFLVNGSKTPPPTTDEDGYYRDVTVGSVDVSVVARSKVSVTLSLSDSSSATLDITYDGASKTAGTAFDVTLGESLSYEVRVTAEGKYFNGWYKTADDEPFPGHGISGTITPTAALDIYAEIGEEDPSAPVYATFAYANGCDATMGTFTVDGTEGPQTAELAYDEGQPPTVVPASQPTNGHLFVGWFADPSAQGASVPLGEGGVLTVRRSGNYYAKFGKNPHSICEWEGEDEPKTMTWRSKTYAASKPFSPSACRVDALGYPPGNIPDTIIPKVLELKVDMFSAPDKGAKPTATTTLTNIANQGARRLPVRRMERYMQVQVRCNREVDALLVGTSMEGLAV